MKTSGRSCLLLRLPAPMEGRYWQRPYCLASRASRMAPGDIGSLVKRTPMAL